MGELITCINPCNDFSLDASCEFDSDLEGFLSRVNELVAFQFGALHKRLAALGADVHTGAVGVEVLPHG